jgi:hypothetical protein
VPNSFVTLTGVSRITEDTTDCDLHAATGADFVYELASSRGTLKTAFSLVHEVYVDAGLMKPHPSGMRITPYMLFPQAPVIVALLLDRMVGTLATILRSRWLWRVTAPCMRRVISASIVWLPSCIRGRRGFSKTCSSIRGCGMSRSSTTILWTGLLQLSSTSSHSRIRRNSARSYGVSGDGCEMFKALFNDGRPAYVFPCRRSLKMTDCEDDSFSATRAPREKRHSMNRR